ncbi:MULTISPECIES: MFS transporter [unclassified Aureimonas]|uniref:MFS transporter n=1 Tax=unclassified Aureimonas TaxID=2615206 RepID=UPI0006F2E528|nr:MULTISPECIES: MFS transporter [unclassified Aureimonas]KQT52854.1 MFS transporter [Aureimonas sp. Leaf427]KQT80313.1 MFS transporter [Aureimonas sp. Leaf460]
MTSPLRAPASLGPGLTLLFAFTCGALAANLYYAQPLVALIGEGMGLAPSAESWLVTAAQIGYGLGLVLLVPLGDVFENRRVILATMAANVAALVGLSLTPGLPALFALMLVVGLTSSAAQMLVPLAASMAPPEARGRVVGNVVTGLLAGILMARPLSGFLAEILGWRGVFAASAGLVFALLLAGAALFPSRRPEGGERYPELIGSLGRLFLTVPVLRRRALYHAALFAAFSLFWTGAPLLLFGEAYRFSAAGVALFALSGVFAAPVAGRLADRGYQRIGTIVAMLAVAAGFASAFLGAHSLVALVVAGVLVDLGVQANLVIGQREILGLNPALRNRMNAVYMATFFCGGALGSALTSPVLQAFGWPGLCALGLGFPTAALLYLATERRAPATVSAA